jgi:hypothetical protein
MLGIVTLALLSETRPQSAVPDQHQIMIEIVTDSPPRSIARAPRPAHRTTPTGRETVRKREEGAPLSGVAGYLLMLRFRNALEAWFCVRISQSATDLGYSEVPAMVLKT